MGLDLDVRQLPVRVLRRVASLPAQATLKVFNTLPVERQLLRRYEQTRAAHCRSLPPLPAEDSAIVRALQQDGYHATSLAAFGLAGTDEMFAQARALAISLARRTRTTRESTTSATGAELMHYPLLFRWGLTERLLRIVEAYLGMPVAYDGLSFFHSRPDGSEHGIRSWHLDREDRRMLKIGIYVSDVGADDGPLQLIPRDLTARLEPHSFRYKPFRQRDLERRLGAPAAAQEAVRSFAGPAGTVIFSDTAQLFHRGCPPTAHARSAIYYSYFSRLPRHPFFCERSAFSRAELAMLAEELAPFQRECVLWRTSLPRSRKWLPRSLT